MEVTKVLTSAEVAEKRAFYDDEWRSESHARFVEAARIDIPALCNSHDVQAGRIAELGREKSELLREQSTRTDWCSTHLGRLRDQVADLTAQLATMTTERDDRVAELSRVYPLVHHWFNESRKLTAQLAERDKAAGAGAKG